MVRLRIDLTRNVNPHLTLNLETDIENQLVMLLRVSGRCVKVGMNRLRIA